MKKEEIRKDSKAKQKKGFAWIKLQKAIVTSSRLTPFDLLVYCIIASHFNSITKLCFPSIARITKEAHLDKKTVLYARRKLKKIGLIKWRLDKTKKNSCLYELPLITGSIEDQQRVIADLRLGGQTDLPRRALKRTTDRGVKRTTDRGVKRTTNKKKLTRRMNNKKKNFAAFFFNSLVQNQKTLPEKNKLILSEKIDEIFGLWSSWDLDPDKLKDFAPLELIIRTEVARRKAKDNPAGFLLKSLEKHYPLKSNSLEQTILNEWFPVPTLQGLQFDHLEREVEKLEAREGLPINKIMSKAVPKIEKNEKINKARLQEKELENPNSMEEIFLDDDELKIGPWERKLKRYISNLTKEKLKFLAGGFSKFREEKQTLLNLRQKLTESWQNRQK